MKFRLTVIVLMIIAFLDASAQEKTVVKAKLNDATVFFQEAELTHKAFAALPQGASEIYIEGISPKLDRNSIKIKADNGVVISAYEFSTDFMTETITGTSVKKLQDSISLYESKLNALTTEKTVNTNLITILQKGTDKNVSGAENGMKIDELSQMIAFYKQRYKELLDNQTENDRKQKELSEALSRLRNQAEQETMKNNKTAGVLKLTLTSPRAVNCNFTLSYYTPSASWSPYYDMTITSTDKPILIALKSKVRQTTGLDWENIKLALSTSAPSNGKVAPLFSAWMLDFHQQFTQPLITKDSEMLRNSFAYEYEAKNILVEEDVTETSIENYVTQSDNELNMTFDIDLPYTIPGNGKEQSIDLQTKETIAEYKYYCAPKLSSDVYLLAEIANWEKLNLLNGKVAITYDGTYIGETYIDANTTQDKLTLTLGTDKRVTVKREKLQDYSATKLVGGEVRQTFGYKISVRNNQNKPIKMVIKDQYPRSAQKEIEVELITKDTTPWTTNKEELGVITWEEELPAGASKEYRIGYGVKYPKDNKPAGL